MRLSLRTALALTLVIAGVAAFPSAEGQPLEIIPNDTRPPEEIGLRDEVIEPVEVMPREAMPPKEVVPPPKEAKPPKETVPPKEVMPPKESAPPKEVMPPEEELPASTPEEEYPTASTPKEEHPPASTPKEEHLPASTPKEEHPTASTPKEEDPPASTPEEEPPASTPEDKPPASTPDDKPPASTPEDKPRSTPRDRPPSTWEANRISTQMRDRAEPPPDGGIRFPTQERRPPTPDLTSQIRQLGETRTRDEADDPRDLPVDPIHSTPRPPTIYGEEIDDPKDPPCCRAVEGIVYFPKPNDWLKPAEEQAALQDEAKAAQGVLLHDGSFALDQADFNTKSVGFPMQISHHYRSNLQETVSGGIIGHKWDLGINKRIVARGSAETPEHLVIERLNADTPRLTYYDGHGRADDYVGIGTNLRTVRNYGGTFKALVTPYRSPPGAFHEIERYILLEGERHPFGNHVNVDPTQRIFYVLREKNGMLYVFNCHGQLIFVIDRHNNRMELRYQGNLNPLTHNPMLSQVIDTAGRKYAFKTIELGDKAPIATNIKCMPVNGELPIPRFETISEEATKRSIKFNYLNGRDPVLESVALNYGRRLVHKYTYAGGSDYLLASVTAPREAAAGGGAWLTNSWDEQNKQVTSQKWGEGSYRLSYTGGRKVTQAQVTDPNGNRITYKMRRLGDIPLRQEMTRTGQHRFSSGPWTHKFEHNKDGQILRIQYPRGNAIAFTYEAGNRAVTLGPNRDWVERDVTWLNNLAQGNLVGITWTGSDGLTSSTTKSYEDLFNQVDQEVDQRGSKTAYRYDYNRGGGYNGNAYEMLLPDLTRPTGGKLAGLKRTYAFASNGLMTEETAPGGRTTSYAYDRSGYLVRLTTPTGTTSYKLDERGNVIEKTMPGGRVDTFAYDLRDLVTEMVVDSTGFANRATYEFDLNGKLTRRTVEIKDNFDGRLTGAKPAGGSGGSLVETFAYDILNRETRSDSQGPGVQASTTRRYDGVGNMISQTAPAIGSAGTITTNVTYDARGLVMEQVDAAGTPAQVTRQFRYDDNGNMTAYFGPDSQHEQTEYDGLDRAKSMVTMAGALATYERDKAGNIIKLTVNGDSGQSGGPRQDNVDLLKTEFAYDELGRQISRRRHLLTVPGAVEEQWIFNAALDLETEKGPGKGSTTYAYDGAGRLMSTTDPSGTVTRHQYDAAGSRSGMTESWTARSYRLNAPDWREDKVERSWTFLTDRLGRMIQQTGPDGTSKHYYDSMGNVRGTLSAQGELTSQTFDGNGRLLTLRAGGQTETYSYSPGGLMTRAVSPMRDESWQYDPLGGLLSYTDGKAGRTVRHKVSAAGYMLSTTDPNGTVTTREFDGAGRATEVSVAPARIGVTIGGTFHSAYRGFSHEEYRYDGLGRLTFASSGGISVQRKYDGLGNVAEDRQTYEGNTQIVQSKVSADLGSRILTYPQIGGGIAVTSDMDDAGRVVAVRAGGSDSIARYYYSGKGYLNARHYGNFVATAYAYDARQRLANIVVMHGAGPSTYRAYWTGRANYDEAVPTSIVQTFSPRRGPEQLFTTDVKLDAKKRPLSTITRQAAVAYLDRPATSTTSAVLRDFDANGRPANVVEYLRDDLAPQDRTAGKILHMQSDVMTYTRAGRVASTYTRVNTDVAGTTEPSLADARTVAEQGRFSREQKFLYDNNGNLLADDRFLYSYDHRNRLTMITDRWEPYRVEQYAVFAYDPLGRRVAIRNRQPGPSGSLMQFGPTYIPDVRFLYDGEAAIVETLSGHPDNRAEVLLARYYHGTGGADLIRMDRRRNESPGGALDTYYFHQGFGGAVALLTDAKGDPATFSPEDGPGRDRPGASDSPPGDAIVITGTRTRQPFSSGSMRIDGFAGMQFDAATGAPVFDFQRNYVLDRDISRDKFRQAIVRFQNRSLVVMGGLVAAPFVVTSWPALAYGTFGLAMDWGTARYTQSGYSLEEGVSTFVISAIGARVGLAVGGGSAWSSLAADYAADVGFGTFIDSAWYDRPFMEALADNMKQSAIFGTVGMASGFTLSAVASKAATTFESYRAPPSAAAADTGMGGRAGKSAPGRTVEEAAGGFCTFCFAAGTRIPVEGGWKPVEQVAVGDRVFSRDEKTGHTGYRTVTETFVTQPATFTHLHYRLLESGRHDGGDSAGTAERDPLVLIGTPTHPVWSQDRRAWIHLGELRVGEKLLLASGASADVIRLDSEQAPDGKTFTAYNFSVDGWVSYFAAPAGSDPAAAAIWVHNTSRRPCKPAAVVRRNLEEGDNPELQKMAQIIYDALRDVPAAGRDAAVQQLMDTYYGGEPIWLYRGINPPGPIDPAVTWNVKKWDQYRKGISGRVVPLGDSTAYLAHILKEDVLTDATSWTLDINIAASSFAGIASNGGIVLAVELRAAAGKLITTYDRTAAGYSKYKHEAELLLHSKVPFDATVVKFPGVEWRDSFLDRPMTRPDDAVIRKFLAPGDKR